MIYCMLPYLQWFLRKKDFDSYEMGVPINLKQTVVTGTNFIRKNILVKVPF